MTVSFASPREIVRRSNRFWHAMYYDALEDQAHCQISFLDKADRLYYNAAHALSDAGDDTLKKIEAAFGARGITPAVYGDPAAPGTLTDALKKSGYVVVPEEQENWYGYILPKTANENADAAGRLRVSCFQPAPGPELDQFMAINAEVNALPEALAHRLKERLLTPKAGVKIWLFLACLDGVPAATTALGLVEDSGFTAEAATLPRFQRKGLFLHLAGLAAQKAKDEGCSAMYVNCDREAFSNQGYLRFGYQSIFTRHYYQKKRGM